MSNTGDLSWGHLRGTEYGLVSRSTDFITVPYEETSKPPYKDWMHAGHCMIFSKYNDKVFDWYEPRAAILMQMRFDGYIGFPGGLIDAGENVVVGLNRELFEEVNYSVNEMPVTQNDHVVSQCNKKMKLVLHFYAKEIPYDDFKEMEKKSLTAHDYGTEVMGIIRVPLYTMGDGYRGFPAFLSNAFVGNSREQLLHSLIKHKLMTQDEIDRALNAKPV